MSARSSLNAEPERIANSQVEVFHGETLLSADRQAKLGISTPHVFHT